MKRKMTTILASTIGMTLIFAGTMSTMLVATSSISLAKLHNGFVHPRLHKDLIQMNRQLHTTVRGPMHNTPPPLNAAQVRSAEALTYGLRFEHLQGRAGSSIIRDIGNIRIDRQGQTSNQEQNIQIQLNIPGGGSTVATVLIPNRYLNVTNPHAQNQVTRQVGLALRRSLASLQRQRPFIYTLDGSLSNTPPAPLKRRAGKPAKPSSTKPLGARPAPARR